MPLCSGDVGLTQALTEDLFVDKPVSPDNDQALRKPCDNVFVQTPDTRHRPLMEP